MTESRTSDPGYKGRFDGIPGLMWYATVQKVRGSDLRVGDWLDSLDHRGARRIYAILDAHPGTRTVYFSQLGDDCENVRSDVSYDVVDPDSQVAPDGSAP